MLLEALVVIHRARMTYMLFLHYNNQKDVCAAKSFGTQVKRRSCLSPVV